MLRVDYEKIEIKGTETRILAEFTMLARNLRKLLAKDQSTEYADAKIAKAIKLSKKTSDEIDEEILKSINELGKMLARVCSEEKSKKENDDKEPSTGNSDFDDFLKGIFGGGAE